MTEEKNYMLVQDGCGVCNDAKELLKEPIKENKLIILDIDSEKGAELAEKHGIEDVPTIINEKDMFQQKCFINEDGKIYCEDGTEKELIKREGE